MDRHATIPSPREEIVIGCPGSRAIGTIINRRFWRWRCTQKFCRHPDSTELEPIHTYHIADLLTGRLVRTEFETHGRAIRPKE